MNRREFYWFKLLATFDFCCLNKPHSASTDRRLLTAATWLFFIVTGHLRCVQCMTRIRTHRRPLLGILFVDAVDCLACKSTFVCKLSDSINNKAKATLVTRQLWQLEQWSIARWSVIDWRGGVTLIIADLSGNEA